MLEPLAKSRLRSVAAAAAAMAALALAAPLEQGVLAQAGPSCTPLSARERAAQTVVTAVPGTRMNATARRLVARNAGSVILFQANVRSARQLDRLTTRLRRAAPLRLLVSADEEGGRVSRLADAGIVDRLPSARRLAATRSERQVRRRGTRLARQMAAVGVNWNLAPVLDVTDARANTVIGDRAYSGRPAKVGRYAEAFARGLSAGGVLATGKHFPGHGRTAVDSHRRLPTVRGSRSKLLRHDVRPYLRARGALDTVMSAHVRYTALDRRNPASLSRAASDLLRKHVGFDGALVTDALEMGAIADRHPLPRAAELAIDRGADMALVGRWRATGDVARRLTRAVADGRISRARLDEAARRVLELKGYSPARIACLLA